MAGARGEASVTSRGRRSHIAERVVQRILFSSRWLLVPLYFALALLLIAFSVHLVRELVEIAYNALTSRDVDLIAAALTMLDLTLMGGLVIMVMLSGYENFVSKLKIAEAEENVAWLGRLDFGSLKVRVLVSIVIISAVELLKVMIDISDYPTERVMWMVAIHLTLVISVMALACLDRLSISKH
jgi:uncharacterized protein (TIGR00645 family)